MNTLWYSKPADDWNEALPVGNGRLAGMVFGKPGYETIQLNEESIWSGKYTNRNNKSCKKALPEIRKLIREGRLPEAQELGYETMTGCPSQQPVYQPAGNLHIDYYTEETGGLEVSFPLAHNGFPNPEMYRRELNLETAVVSSSFVHASKLPSNQDFSRGHGASVSYKREVFVPAGLDVMVIHITASTPKSIYLRANLERGNFASSSFALSEDTIELQDTHGIPFVVLAMASCSGGKVCTRGANLIVEGADEVNIFVDVETAFRNRHYARKGGNVHTSFKRLCLLCEAEALKKICYASCVNYEKIYSTHVSEYSELYGKVSLSLGGDDAEEAKVSTDRLLKEYPQSLALAELFWNYGRYLLISSSRNPGTLPANLQGIWCKDMDPPWGCKYTININTEMNYWPCNMLGLSETEMPLFKLLKRAYKHGKKTASEMYGVDGFVAHHNLDIWGDTAPQDEWLPGTYWVLGAAWLATHVREHYEYTQDKKFLKKNYVYLRRACDFFVDYLVKSDEGDYLVVNPSVSPENSYRLANGVVGAFSAGTDMDNRILEHLFTATIQSANDLGISPTNVDVAKYKAVLAKIEGVAVTAENTIREWPFKCEEVEPGHRHISQLYGLFPGHSISYTRTPELAKAAHNTIEKRIANGGGHTGWSQSWIMNFRASLHEKDEAYKSLVALFEKSTLSNLFDNHPPFQIDGNFGSVAAMTRMLVQSEMVDGKVEISLLPALPDAWKTGALNGVVLKGNIRMNLEWKEGKLSKAELYTIPGSKYKDDIVVWYNDHRFDSRLVDGRLDLMNVVPDTI